MSQHHPIVSTDQVHSPRQCAVLSPHAQQILRHFTQNAYESYLHGCPTSDHLLTLSKVNVFRAFGHILSILGMSDAWLYDEAISPFSTAQPGYVEDSSLPLTLRPTALQRTQPHHPWIDFFPLPRMRDNLLLAEDSYDEDQLCIDIMGFWDPPVESYSLLVWGNPANPANWEVTEAFLRKWPWVIRGCPELIQSTNHWRRKRGERVIFRYL